MKSDTFASYRNYRWLKLSILALLFSSAIYLCNNPYGGRNGGTVLGYTYGGISTFFILYLMFFGVRKRMYRSNIGTLKGWLAAHIWLGVLLVFLVPLHAGFSFGYNVHTLAYVLMFLTIASGIWGALNYWSLAPEVLSHRGAGTLKDLYERLDTLKIQLSKVLEAAGEELKAIAQKFEVQPAGSMWQALRSEADRTIDTQALAAMVVKLKEAEHEKAAELINILNRRTALCNQIDQEARAKALLQIWLYFHVPLSFALIAVLAVHIFSVFFYW